MPNTHTSLTSLFSDIADEIRAKTGGSAIIKADDFPTAISQISSQNKNILDDYTVQAGGFSYSYGNNYAVVSRTDSYYFGLITLEAGKLYELHAPKTTHCAFLLVDENNKWCFNSHWQTENLLYIVTTENQKVAIVFETQNGANVYQSYANEFVLCESEKYVADKINLNFGTSDWAHNGIWYSYGRSFTEAKQQGSSSQFRYEALIPVDSCPYLMINATNLTVAIQQYDSNELGKVDSGWLTDYMQAPVWYENIAIAGNSSLSINAIIEKMQAGFNIFILKKTTEQED